MSKDLSSRRGVTRRGFLTVAVSAIVAGVVAGVGAYYAGTLAAPAEVIREVTKTVERTTTVTAPPTTVTKTVTTTVTVTPAPAIVTPTPPAPDESPLSKPWLLKEYPLILTTGGRKPAFFHSEGRQIPWLRELHPDPLVEIHPQTTEQLGIKDGDWVYIETRRGKCKMKASLSIGIHPKVVRAEHNWWYPEKLGKAPLHEVLEPNCNQCVSYEEVDPAIGSTPVRVCLCKVYKA